ncbi:MAG: hypothetical protein AAFY29_10950 [Pseudomonadota bacterium]
MADIFRLVNRVKHARLQAIATDVSVGHSEGNRAQLWLLTGSPPLIAGAATVETVIMTVDLPFPLVDEIANANMAWNPLDPGIALDAGTIGWGRFVRADGTTVVGDCSAGLQGSNSMIELSQVDVLAGTIITISIANIAEL